MHSRFICYESDDDFETARLSDVAARLNLGIIKRREAAALLQFGLLIVDAVEI